VGKNFSVPPEGLSKSVSPGEMGSKKKSEQLKEVGKGRLSVSRLRQEEKLEKDHGRRNRERGPSKRTLWNTVRD